MSKDIKKILFVCTGNSCRSVMAEYYFKKIVSSSGLDIKVVSAGTAAGGMGASFDTLQVLNDEGIDAGQHQSQPVTEQLVNSSDLICVMTKDHERQLLHYFPDISSKTVLFTKYYDGPDKDLLSNGLPDPIGLGGDFYSQVFNIVKNCSENLLKELMN